jgi:hypothetical protein
MSVRSIVLLSNSCDDGVRAIPKAGDSENRPPSFRPIEMGICWAS